MESLSDETLADARPLLFVSYSRIDFDRARPVIGLLEAAGFNAWWDGRLEGGENFLQTTEIALEAAVCVVVLWSETSVDSHWVRDEAQRGRERGCLVPLTIDGTIAPLGFRQFQLLDISGWDGAPGSPEAARILVAVRAMTGRNPEGAAPAPAPTAPASAPVQTSGQAFSRRTLMLGGAGAVAVAGTLGAWQFGLFGSSASAATSMVVLPFANETGDPTKKYFSDGLARELRTVLARNPRLKIAAPTSSIAIDDEDDFAIGRKLGVDNILRGSVQRDTARLRITAELVAIEGGVVRWAETYDRALDDVFAVQTDISETVALSLIAEVAGEDEAKRAVAAQKDVGGTESVAAYEAYLRGVAVYSLSIGEESDRAALAQFEAAIDLDQSYAAAYAMRSTALAAIANAASDAEQNRQFYAEAIAAAERAIAIEPKLALGHLALGFALNNGQLRRSAAAEHYKAAQQLAPGDADVLRGAATFQSYGTDKALAGQMIAKVLALDPINPRAFQAAGFIALFARDYPLVVTRMQRALHLNPGSPGAQFGIALARLCQGDAAGALAAAAQEPVPLFRLTASAAAAAKQGDAATADAALGALIRDYGDASLYQQAQVHAQRGAVEPAVAALEKAFAMRDSGVLWAPNDPLLDPLRSEARFKDLLIRLGT